MGKFRDYAIGEITIEQAVNVLARISGDDVGSVITGICGAIDSGSGDFELHYEETSISEDEVKICLSKVIECENNWGWINADPAHFTSTAETKDGKPILFRKFQARISELEKLLKCVNLPVPDVWLDERDIAGRRKRRPYKPREPIYEQIFELLLNLKKSGGNVDEYYWRHIADLMPRIELRDGWITGHAKDGRGVNIKQKCFQNRVSHIKQVVKKIET